MLLEENLITTGNAIFTFTPFTSLFIANNLWNIVGIFIQGFDFTRSDGRDANAYVENNTGDMDHNPTCKINVINNTTTTSAVSAATWYKASWINTSVNTSKWSVSDNRITFLSQNKRDGYAIISGDLSITHNNRTVSIAIVKNGVSANVNGETTLRVTTANQPFQFSTVIYLQNINKNDYFELWFKTENNDEIVNFQDIQWFTETK